MLVTQMRDVRERDLCDDCADNFGDFMRELVNR